MDSPPASDVSDLFEDYTDESDDSEEQKHTASTEGSVPPSKKPSHAGVYKHATTKPERASIRDLWSQYGDLTKVCGLSGRRARVVRKVLMTPEEEFTGRGRKVGEHYKFGPQDLDHWCFICTQDPWASISECRWRMLQATGVQVSARHAWRLRDETCCKLKIESRPKLTGDAEQARRLWIEKVVSLGGYRRIIFTDEKWFVLGSMKGKR